MFNALAAGVLLPGLFHDIFAGNALSGAIHFVLIAANGFAALVIARAARKTAA